MSCSSPPQDLDAIEAELVAEYAHCGYDISKVSPGNLGMQHALAGTTKIMGQTQPEKRRWRFG